jgi:hypothetical protein
MRWRSLFVQMLFAVTLPIASSDVWAQPQDITGVWRDETANNNDATTPEKIVLPKKPAMSNNFHGTYASKPYLLIQLQDQQKPNGPFYLYSDVGDLRVELRATAATPTDYDMVDRRTNKIIGTLSMDAPECHGRPACFALWPPAKDTKDSVLASFAKDLGFDSFRDKLPILYTPVGIYDPTLDPQLDQTFGNMFSPVSANFGYILKCWHLKHMSQIDYQVPGCGQDVFTMPDTKSFGYRKVGFANWHNAAIPFGWTYVSTLFQNGEDRGQTWENGQDVADADSLKIGVGVSLNVFGVTAGTHVSVGVQHKVEDMYNSKLTYAKAEYLSTQFALVLHKFYAAPLLDPSFVDRVLLIQGMKEADRGQEYDRFVSDFGTHYANAITFGSKGERVLKMTQHQVLTMHEGQVNVSAGISAGYMGNSAKVDVDFSKSNMEKLTNNTSREDRQWFCYSGGACNDGIPSGDAVLPVQLDLRPISDLFAPPFFADDEIITTMRDGISRAVAKAAFAARNNLNQPAAVFATVTGLNRYNLLSFGTMQEDPQPCGEANPCNIGVVTLTSEDDLDGLTVKTLTGSEAQPITWTVPATLDPNQGSVTANFTWSGNCLAKSATFEWKDSVTANVSVSDLTLMSQDTRSPHNKVMLAASSCELSNNPNGLVTVIDNRTITGVGSARTFLGQ